MQLNSYACPKKAPKKSAIQRCQEGLFAKIKKLRELRVLNHSLNPTTSHNDFEVLEWYGDSVLYERIAFFLFKTRRFMSPDLLSRIRQEAVNNRNLANCYDILNLRGLVDSPPEHVKPKADIVEAIIGELAEASVTRDIHGNEIKAVLDELLAFIAFCGEREYFSLYMNSIIGQGHAKDLNTPALTSFVQQPAKIDTKSPHPPSTPPTNKCMTTCSSQIVQILHNPSKSTIRQTRITKRMQLNDSQIASKVACADNKGAACVGKSVFQRLGNRNVVSYTCK
jgi:hypothetical protein